MDAMVSQCSDDTTCLSFYRYRIYVKKDSTFLYELWDDKVGMTKIGKYSSLPEAMEEMVRHNTEKIVF